MIPPLHLVTDDAALADTGFVEKARAAIVSGANRVAFHLRGPRSSGRRVYDAGMALRAVARAAGATFLVNDRVDIARALDADGAHLGARSLPTPVTRSLLSRTAVVGRSVHGPEEAVSSQEDYLFAGPVNATASHPAARPAGLGLITRVLDACPEVPVIAIGGITRERVAGVIRSGASGVAVVSAWWNAADPGDAVVGLLQALSEASEPVGAPGASGR